MSDKEIEQALNGQDGPEKDRAIVAALSGEDRRLQTKAVKELLRQLRPMLRAYTFKNSGTSKDGDDLANEVVGILYEKVKSSKYEQRDEAKLTGYCYRIGMNIWLKGLRDDDLSLDDDNVDGGSGNTPPNGEDPTGPFDDVEDGSITSPAMQKAWRAFQKLGPTCQRMVRLELDGVINEEVVKEFPGMTVEQLKKRRYDCKKEWMKLIELEASTVNDAGSNETCLERAHAGLTPGQRKLLELDRNGLNETQIQAVFGYETIGAVKVNRARANKRLKELYDHCMNGNRDKQSDGTHE